VGVLLLVMAGIVAWSWRRGDINDPVTFWLFVALLAVAGTGALALWHWGPR
jgi:hypothetical protein